MCNGSKNTDLITTLVLKYHDELLTYTRRKLHNSYDSEEILSELWFLAISKRDTLENHPNKIAWLYKSLNMCMLQHKYKDYKRKTVLNNGIKERKYIRIDTVPLEYIENNVSQDVPFYEGEQFSKYKNLLTDKEIRYLNLRYVFQLTNKEIALIEKRSVSAITSTSNRVNNKIRKFYENMP